MDRPNRLTAEIWGGASAPCRLTTFPGSYPAFSLRRGNPCLSHLKRRSRRITVFARAILGPGTAAAAQTLRPFPERPLSDFRADSSRLMTRRPHSRFAFCILADAEKGAYSSFQTRWGRCDEWGTPNSTDEAMGV
ncbi:hypothetical protein CSUI_000407 [Cystoisospora suis]|uniref:Uncharacterized protein n=1 Tax=Cystoisospora suis TaxID=483139 RepID=A0A2C6LE66_9APIC|nr:hypothetical protein CSUI_000407 [Cystoisospora suis]